MLTDGSLCSICIMCGAQFMLLLCKPVILFWGGIKAGPGSFIRVGNLQISSST